MEKLWRLGALLLLALACSCNAEFPQLLAQATTSTTINVFQPADRGQPSDAWRPTIYTSCMPGMHNESAPCLSQRIPQLVYAEELHYPDFRISLPHFVDPTHKQLYLRYLQDPTFQRMWTRALLRGDYAYYLNVRGQNLVYGNVTYNGRPAPSSWVDDACMSGRSHEHVAAFAPWSSPPGGATSEAAMFVASPDDQSFQHFMDRVSVMLGQTHHLRGAVDWQYMTTPPQPGSPVDQLWSLLVPGAKPAGFLNPRSTPLHARLFCYPCQAPLTHPYMYHLRQEVLVKAAGIDASQLAPIRERKLIAFMTRSGTSGSRGWHNEAECRMQLEQLLQSRGKNESLVNFRASMFPTVQDTIKFFQDVKLMVGVHGGALYNHAFMTPGTGLVEVCPYAPDGSKPRCGAAIWEQASLMNMPFWHVAATKTNSGYEVLEFDCGLLSKAVTEALEKVGVADGPLEHYYQGTSHN